MLRPFFDVAMLAPGRQLTFRRVVVGHVFLVGLAAWVLLAGPAPNPTVFGYALLSLGLVEAAALVGWRLSQMPKSQALEFLLVSPVQPKRLFLAEALVGMTRFALVWFSALPVYLCLIVSGLLDVADLGPLFVMPFIWGLASAGCVTAWVYEPVIVRRLGEVLGFFAVLVYLVVGVLAAEHLMTWLAYLPTGLAKFLHGTIIGFHQLNPFGIVQYWFSNDSIDWIADERYLIVLAMGAGLALISWTRAAFRLKGHFHDRHYTGKHSDSRNNRDDAITFSQTIFPYKFTDKPLSWWAVRRVMEYSGRVNVYLAGGFSLVYSAYLMAGDNWPAWMGKLVFQLFAQWGGAPTVATALCVLAVVPAVFQFGLWDSTVQNRCKRLELLLLTEFNAWDYWHASLMAALKRGRAYLFISAWLWTALVISGAVPWYSAVASLLAAVALWMFGFALGFRSFSTGNQSSGLASMFTLGQPIALMGCIKYGYTAWADLIPLGLCHTPVTSGLTPLWGVTLIAMIGATVWMTRTGLKKCDGELRAWYDANQGKKAEGS